MRATALALVLAAMLVPVAVAGAPVATPPAAPGGTADYHRSARAAVATVLAAPEFRGPATGSQLWRRIERWLLDALAAVGRAVRSLPVWAFWLLIIWLVLTLLAILAHMLYVLVGLFGDRTGGARSTIRSADPARPWLGLVDLDYESARQHAAELAVERRWSDAVKYLYMAAILRLDRAGLIGFRPTKTNRDFVRELARHPQQQAGFQRLTSRFEATAYGGRGADEARCREMTALLDALYSGDANPQV